MTDLRALASEIAEKEGLGASVNVAQVAEIIGIIGARWRSMPEQEALTEFRSIRERAGVRSQHRK